MKTGAIAFASASAASVSPGTAAASSRVSPVRSAAEPRRVCFDDPLAVEEQADGGVLLAAGGVADQLDAGHAPRLA